METPDREILGLLRQTAKEAHQTVVMVTHDPVAASHANTVLFLADGQIADTMSVGTTPEAAPDRIAKRMTRLEACG